MSLTRDLVKTGTDYWDRWPLNHCLLTTRSHHYTPTPLSVCILCYLTQMSPTRLIITYPWCQRVPTFVQRNHSPLSGRNCRVVWFQMPLVVDWIHVLTAEIPTWSIILSLHTSLFPQFPWRLRCFLSSLFSKEMRAPNVCDEYSTCELFRLWRIVFEDLQL